MSIVTHNTTPSTGLVQEIPLAQEGITHQLHQKAQQYLTLGLATTTRATYSTAWQKFASFCTRTHKSPIPASEQILLMFVSSLATNNISQGTIKVYLSAVRHMHVIAGLHTFFSQQLTP